jgi:hypothetical protein
LVQAFKSRQGGYTAIQTHREHSDLISLLYFFLNKGSRLKDLFPLSGKVGLRNPPLRPFDTVILTSWFALSMGLLLICYVIKGTKLVFLNVVA